MAIKSILGGKSKNLFDISKAKVVMRNDGSFYSTKDYDSNFYALLVEAGQTYTVSCDCFATAGEGTQLQLNCQTGTSYITGTRLFVQLTTKEMINAWQHIVRTFTVPSDVTQIYFSTLKNMKYFRNFQIEKGSTATDYVSYEITSYKSIMKVSDVCQLVPISDKADEVVSEVTFTNNHDGGWTISGTPSFYTWYSLFLDMPLKNGHKYLNTNAGGNTYVEIKWRDKDGVIHWGANPYTADENSRCDVTLMRGTNATGVKIVFPQLFDLTEMYGAGNEPKTVAEFKAKFPNDYYPYSPSCFVTSFDERMPCKTKNLFDINAEMHDAKKPKYYIEVIGNIVKTNYDISHVKHPYIEVPVEIGETYTFSCKAQRSANTINIFSRVRYPDNTVVTYISNGTTTKTFTATQSSIQVCFGIDTGGKQDTSQFELMYDIQLEKGSTAADYVPYDYV